jgi:hypothetical protein
MYEYRALFITNDPRHSYPTAAANTSSKYARYQNCVLRQRPGRVAETAAPRTLENGRFSPTLAYSFVLLLQKPQIMVHHYLR